ncbi:class I SAM-dependent methyltransferase [Streptomyces sp. NPDC050388]|uniref:class I SAM-dependent DNA methyltransferase n=1 Tax=Streptomyces sp. NPDC050388 TaxID=3155781 RepID=UPI00342638CC
MTWNEQTYGARWANAYDEQPWPDPKEAVDFLAELAGDEPLLELAIGTGRIAVPLVERGVEVHGTDISEAMIARLREKPAGKDIPVERGDLRDFTTSRKYRTAALVLNTIYALANQEEQVACFRQAAKALEPGGRFVVEAFVPDVTRFHRGSRAHVYDVGVGHVTIEADVHDRAKQTVLEQHVRITEQGITMLPAFLRYIHPSEMDLMAKLAGLELENRYGGWRREPYTQESENQVSVYRAPSGS